MSGVISCFTSYYSESQIDKSSLEARTPPLPIYSAPINKVAYLKALILDAVFMGHLF